MSIVLVAIDGPAGSGKTTVAKEVAARLGLRHLDTGAMYRCLAYKLIKNHEHPSDQDAVRALLASTQITFVDDQVVLDGQILDREIRTPDVSRAASEVAAVPSVRAWMLGKQRELMHLPPGSVAEGRDIGTVVAPDAQIKVFLTADPNIRASRRAKESGQNEEDELEQVRQRDLRDEQRDHSPLVAAGDAILIDSTKMKASEVVEEIVALVKANWPG